MPFSIYRLSRCICQVYIYATDQSQKFLKKENNGKELVCPLPLTILLFLKPQHLLHSKPVCLAGSLRETHPGPLSPTADLVFISIITHQALMSILQKSELVVTNKCKLLSLARAPSRCLEKYQLFNKGLPRKKPCLLQAGHLFPKIESRNK